MTIHTNIILLILLVVSAVVIAQENNPKRKPDASTEMPVRVKSPKERERMIKYLEEMNDPGIINKTITLSDGDVVQCLDIYLQLGKSAALTKIALPPAQKDQADIPDGGEFAKQIYGKRDICPEGTVPRRQVTINELERFETLEEYFHKLPGGFKEIEDVGLKRDAGPTNPLQYALYYQYVTNFGVDSVLNVWSPYTELPTEFSLSQQWVEKGFGSDLETVEAGWQVYRQKYGDTRSRLFIYFTSDSYGGCYNKDCGAFIQVSNAVLISGAFDLYSTAGGTQIIIRLRLQQAADGNWWLRYGNTWIGYWPAAKFDSQGLRNGADRILFGGEILDQRYLNLHTATDMGSGFFPSSGFGYACYQRTLKYSAGSAAAPVWTTVSGTQYVTGANCYDETNGYDFLSWGRYIYFGGPGYHPNNCY